MKKFTYLLLLFTLLALFNSSSIKKRAARLRSISFVQLNSNNNSKCPCRTNLKLSAIEEPCECDTN